jgi:hypothetical protein
MQATLFWACAIAPKRLRRFAHAQNDLIWTAADATELDLAAAPNGGYRVSSSALRKLRRVTGERFPFVSDRRVGRAEGPGKEARLHADCPGWHPGSVP